VAPLVLVIFFNNDKKDTFIMNNDIIDILLHNFSDEKTLAGVRDNYKDLELLIERERATNSENSHRLAALNVLAQLQLKLVLEELAETPDKGGESTIQTKWLRTTRGCLDRFCPGIWHFREIYCLS
jgi:hypothetical protein